jgi:hypothetical protein
MPALKAWRWLRGYIAVDVLTTLDGVPYQVRIIFGRKAFYSRLLNYDGPQSR